MNNTQPVQWHFATLQLATLVEMSETIHGTMWYFDTVFFTVKGLSSEKCVQEITTNGKGCTKFWLVEEYKAQFRDGLFDLLVQNKNIRILEHLVTDAVPEEGVVQLGKNSLSTILEEDSKEYLPYTSEPHSSHTSKIRLKV